MHNEVKLAMVVRECNNYHGYKCTVKQFTRVGSPNGRNFMDTTVYDRLEKRKGDMFFATS